jgi:hypothetical protein
MLLTFLPMDIVVHGQHIALSLNRALPVPPDAALNALERAWSMGWPFQAPTKLAGCRLTATDWAEATAPPSPGRH